MVVIGNSAADSYRSSLQKIFCSATLNISRLVYCRIQWENVLGCQYFSLRLYCWILCAVSYFRIYDFFNIYSALIQYEKTNKSCTNACNFVVCHGGNFASVVAINKQIQWSVFYFIWKYHFWHFSRNFALLIDRKQTIVLPEYWWTQKRSATIGFVENLELFLWLTCKVLSSFILKYHTWHFTRNFSLLIDRKQTIVFPECWWTQKRSATIGFLKIWNYFYENVQGIVRNVNLSDKNLWKCTQTRCLLPNLQTPNTSLIIHSRNLFFFAVSVFV